MVDLAVAAVVPSDAILAFGGVPVGGAVARVGALSETGAAFLAAGLVLVCAGAALLWLLVSLSAQNGRLLARLEAAEAALRVPAPGRGAAATEGRGGSGAVGGSEAAPIADDPAPGAGSCARCLAECQGRGGGAACGSVCRLAGRCA